MIALVGWSRASTAERLVVDCQMLIRCGRCRTYNVVPTARLAEEPREVLAMVHDRLTGFYIRDNSIRGGVLSASASLSAIHAVTAAPFFNSRPASPQNRRGAKWLM